MKKILIVAVITSLVFTINLRAKFCCYHQGNAWYAWKDKKCNSYNSPGSGQWYNYPWVSGLDVNCKS